MTGVQTCALPIYVGRKPNPYLTRRLIAHRDRRPRGFAVATGGADLGFPWPNASGRQVGFIHGHYRGVQRSDAALWPRHNEALRHARSRQDDIRGKKLRTVAERQNHEQHHRENRVTKLLSHFGGNRPQYISLESATPIRAASGRWQAWRPGARRARRPRFRPATGFRCTGPATKACGAR